MHPSASPSSPLKKTVAEAPRAFAHHRRPRLAVVTPFVDRRHGTERCLAEEIDRLKLHFEVHLFARQVNDLELDGVIWHRIAGPSRPHLLAFLWWYLANRGVRRYQQRRTGESFDLVYSAGINCPDADVISVHVLFSELHQRLRPALRKFPMTHRARLFHRRLFYRLISHLEARLYGSGRSPLVAISQRTQKALLERFPEAQVVGVAYYGIDPARFNPDRRRALRAPARASLRLQPETFTVLFVGNDLYLKGLDTLAAAVHQLNDRRLELLICTTEDLEPYRHAWPELRALPVRPLPLRPDIEAYYAAADALAAPTREDAFGLPVLEAMACGLPVVVSRAAGAAELITHGEDGLILEDPEDSATLANWLGRLLRDPDLCARLGEQAARTAARYTWSAHAEKVLGVLEAVLEQRRSRTP